MWAKCDQLLGLTLYFQTVKRDGGTICVQLLCGMIDCISVKIAFVQIVLEKINTKDNFLLCVFFFPVFNYMRYICVFIY